LPIFSEPVKLTIQVNIVANVGLTQVDISAADDLLPTSAPPHTSAAAAPGKPLLSNTGAMSLVTAMEHLTGQTRSSEITYSGVDGAGFQIVELLPVSSLW
jgi:hypothetical protein